MTKKLLLLCFLSVNLLHADFSCVDYTTYNLETGVNEQGPLRYVGCTCNCAQYRWLPNDRCIECDHKHGGARTTGNIQFAKFTSTWLPGLMAFVENKREQQAAESKAGKAMLLAQGGSYYDGDGMMGQSFDGPGIGIYDEDTATFDYTSDDSDSGDDGILPDFGSDFTFSM